MTSALKKPRSTKTVTVIQNNDDIDAELRRNSQDIDLNLVQYIDDNVIGRGSSFCGPFGRRKVVYCDYNGSGRALQFIEEHIGRDVLSTHATQCTAMSHTSLQTNLYRSEARTTVLNSVGGDENDDVIVLGSSLMRFVRALRLEHRIAVFVSARETERNLTVWRECSAEIIKIAETKDGYIDLNNLETKLQEYSGSGKKMIGYFSAVSKLTGILADDVATTIILHQYGAWAFWDYTLVAPSAPVDMNPSFPGVDDCMVKKDAIFFNSEKFVGGVQGPYVTVVKKHVFLNSPFYSDDVKVLSEHYEDCTGVEAVRAALVLQLKDSVGLQQISDRQDNITKQVLAHIKNIPELILLGNESLNVRRLPIFSLLVKHPRGTFLHHNFICAVLNDVFGIQARGGLSGSLSYGQDVLGIDEQLLNEYEKILNVHLQKEIGKEFNSNGSPDIVYNEHLRPGFFRISLPYFMSENELAFVLEAIKMVATEGWKILPQYVVNPENGQWRHYTNAVFKDRKSLFNIHYNDGKMTANDRRFSGPGIFPQTYTECLQTARNLFSRARKLAMKCSVADQEVTFNPKMEYLRWFMLPKEAHELLLGKSSNVKQTVPFDPSGFTGARKSLSIFKKGSCSPHLSANSRHYSLSSIDDCRLMRFKEKQNGFSRDPSLVEAEKEEYKVCTVANPPVQFAVGERVSPIQLKPLIGNISPNRSRCYSLGSDCSIPSLSPQIRASLDLEGDVKKMCHCGSQTDLYSLDEPLFSPTKVFCLDKQDSTSDCSQVGRSSPTASITSQTSEDIEAYVKEMTKEIATELKSEIREVISRVEDVLENSEAVEVSSSRNSSISDRNSVSVVDVAEYLMGMSREMASEVKNEIREMVNQVDVMMSPNNSRRSSPPETLRRRFDSGSELGLTVEDSVSLRKSPTSPISLKELDDSKCFNRIQKKSIKSPSQESNHNSVSFNSSETSTPETIVQMATTSIDTRNLPKSLYLKSPCDDVCTCSQYCTVKKWFQKNRNSLDVGNNDFTSDSESYNDFVKWRALTESSSCKLNNCKNKKLHQLYEKCEIPDIIEGMTEHGCDNKCFKAPKKPNRTQKSGDAVEETQRSSNSSNTSSGSSEVVDGSRTSGYESEQKDNDECNRVCKGGVCCVRKISESSSEGNTDSSITEFTYEDDDNWRSPTKYVWKPSVEAIREFNMIRHQDKVLVCVSGSQKSIALLHTIHQYQFYTRAKGIYFSIAVIYVNDGTSSMDPLHLMSYCETLGVKFIYQDNCQPITTNKKCVWNKSSMIARQCSNAGGGSYTLTAVADTLDDAARTFMASALHRGTLHTLRPHAIIREKNVRIIRPFIYVRDKHIKQFAETKILPQFKYAADENTDVFHTKQETGSTHRSWSGDRSISEPCGVKCLQHHCTRMRTRSEPITVAQDVLDYHEIRDPYLFTNLRNTLHILFTAKNLHNNLKERHRKKSVIQMRNGAPVYSDTSDEEPVP